MAKSKKHKQIERKSWDAFRKYGLLTIMNSFLHIFGWVIVVEYADDGKFKEAYPARTCWRGFPEASMTKAYTNVTNMLAKDIGKLTEDVKEG